MSYLAGLSLVAVSLTGCPLDEPPSVNGDQGVACTEEYWPVCGVDGVTYGNGCLAEAAGVTVAFTGACDDTELTPCGGVYGNTCADDEYCDVAVGFDYDPALPYPTVDAGGAPRPAYDGGMAPPIDPTGVCRPLPQQGCRDDRDCNAGEYCDAAVGLIADPAFPAPPLYDGGIVPGYDASVVPPGGVCRPIETEGCGGPNGVTCPDGFHCETGSIMADLIPLPWDGGAPQPQDAGPGSSDAGAPIPWDGGAIPPYGICVPDEEPGCPDVTELVCGSNGITYQNACVAESMGATIVSQGRCPRPDDRACGGWSGDTCTSSEYCYFEPASWCDYADASGVCRPRPEVCTREYSPVCGCNGETYSNACVAAAAGTSVATYGACDTDPVPGGEGSTCGGLIGAGCDMGLFCSFPEEALCGAADQTGVCTVLAQVCPDVWAPVCGCDGDIYGNSCEAQAAGVSVAPMSSCLNR